MSVKSKLWSSQPKWQFLLKLISRDPGNFLFIINNILKMSLVILLSLSVLVSRSSAEHGGDEFKNWPVKYEIYFVVIELRSFEICLYLHIFRPGPWVESTKGEIWPKPKVQKSQPEFFSVRSSSLKFEVRKKVRIYSHSCKIFSKMWNVSTLYAK